jgi:peptidoglycan/LPS O-acetylase OafA/YrhL
VSETEVSVQSERSRPERQGPHRWLALDGLRGVAILMVVTVHFWAHSTPTGQGFPVVARGWDVTRIFANGHDGVIIFFVLSGFLLHSGWLNGGYGKSFSKYFTRVRHYAIRRVRRILPAFAFFLVLYILLAVIVGRNPNSSSIDIGNFVANIFFLTPLAVATGIGPTPTSLDIIPGTWSLNPEIWFYLLLPLLFVPRMPRVCRWALLFIALVFGHIYRSEMIGAGKGFVVLSMLPGYIDIFAAGMIAAELGRQLNIRRWASVSLCLVGLALFIFGYAGDPASTLILLDHDFHIAIATGLLVLGLSAECGGGRLGGLFRIRPLVWVGKISYSLFLCNIVISWYFVGPLAESLDIESPRNRLILSATFGFGLALLVSALTYRWVEEPFIRWTGWKQPKIGLPRAVALAVALLMTGILLGNTAYFRQGDFGSTYSSPRVKVLSDFLPSDETADPLIVSASDRLIADTSAGPGKHAIATQITPGTYALSMDDASALQWIAIRFPVSLTSSGDVRLSAKLHIDDLGGGTACLGIYDGTADKCSQRISAPGDYEITVAADVRVQSLAQFKLSIFPSIGPIRVEISQLAAAVVRR